MAEEKKPKIDLKARLGKGGGAPPPPASGGIPVPTVSSPGAAVPAAAPSATGLPVPPGIPVGPPPSFGQQPQVAIDPSNPLAAAATPYRPSQAPAQPAPAALQRIEVDELGVQQARKAALKQGVLMGLVGAVVLGAVGFVFGGAVEAGKGRQRAVLDAKALSGDVTKSREQLKSIADKVEAGKNSLLKDKKFPDTLAKELGAINVDFDGNKLAGVRFSGFRQETTAQLIEYITQVQAINDRKTAVLGLLSRTQKPITEQLAAGQKVTISYAVFLGGGVADPSKNPFAMLAPLQKPIEAANAGAITIPDEINATDVVAHKPIKAPKYTSGNLEKASAMYVLPKSIEAACPTETAGAVAQLASQLGRLINDIRGEQPAAGADPVDAKPGLLDRADKLVGGLNSVH